MTARAEELIGALKARGLMLATAESCTAGLISAAVTDVAGASAVFDRGFVTYSNAAKVQMLGVSEQTLADFGAVSEEVATQMAAGALAHSAAQIAVAVTGIAGPGGTEHKPEGRVCFGIARGDLPPRTFTREFGAIGRSNVRSKTVETAISSLIETLDAQP